MSDRLPSTGAWVRDPSIKERTFGEVKRVIGAASEARLEVQWLSHPSKKVSTERPDRLRCGFLLGMLVAHVPTHRLKRPLGLGEVARVRTLGGDEMVLVDFLEAGQRLWVHYTQLRSARGVEQRFKQGIVSSDADRFRLRCLAHALDLWNENTGALSHFDIDPLPHQIHLVHRILRSGHLNWMIADDVGLGKTIEAGMLLSAVRQRGQCRRILLITPPGLTVQWQEELAQKFGMDDFRIYGRDFEIHDERHWKLQDLVIASIDRLKQEQHLESLLKAEPWDLVIFDEAHRLSRRQYGLSFDASQRFELAARLRGRTQNMLLLTATPHQGMSDKFQALLNLLRPEREDEIRLLELNPEILRDMIIRNRKDNVTDANGEFIFKGKETHAVSVPVSDEARAFDQELQKYLLRGDAAGAAQQGRQGRAIGFVMNTYRKLAASSAAAIHQALRRRRERLTNQYRDALEEAGDFEQAPEDARYEGEFEELHATGSAQQFFEGELALLDELIEKAERLLGHDAKLQAFIDQMLSLIHAQDEREKILIFTEYRATQSYLKKALEERVGAGSVELIHGGQKHDERREAIRRFEDEAKFLISTEAGGEGINLQRYCHMLVNYDLPWNPMRLVQRIGRVYRYGQQKPVVVFNMHAPETVDASIVGLLYNRLESVVRDMASVSSEFRAGLEDGILGQMAELLDVEHILANAGSKTISRSQEEIDEALQRAKSAVEMQRDLFQHVSGYDPDETRGELRMGREHLEAFVRAMFAMLGVKELATQHRGLALELELPDELLQELPGWRRRLRVSFDRAWAASRADIHCLDLSSPLVRLLLEKAKAYDFQGHCVATAGLSGKAVLAGILRWQNAEGIRLRQEFVALQVTEEGRFTRNSDAFSRWLLQAAPECAIGGYDRSAAAQLFNLAESAADTRLQELSNAELYPENRQWVGAAVLA